MARTPLLKLVALDKEDLQTISAHLQDAVMRVADIAYLPKEKRFVALCNRFDWPAALAGDKSSGQKLLRSRSALRFERVLGAKLQNIRLDAKDDVLSLLAIQFEETDPPGGSVTLLFSASAAIRLDVECIEAELRDLGPSWRARRRPEHERQG